MITNWTHKTSLTPTHVDEVPVPDPESEWSCACMLELLMSPFYILPLDFRPIPIIANPQI